MNFTIGASILVHIAAVFYVAGFLVKDQLILRGLIFMGTLCYLSYYYFALDEPLWDAFIWSVIMGAANLFIIVQLAWERTTLGMSEADKALYTVFDTMRPGEFRKLMKLATRKQVGVTTTLVAEGVPVKDLYYVMDGGIEIAKGAHSFRIEPGTFIGEVGYFLNQSASATVRLDGGGSYVSWDGTSLRQLQKKSPAIRAALHSTLNVDMARKVAQSGRNVSLAPQT
ncbi:MAG: cyclic nucleotide-binding domain-containing protein [Pseudomonadota bacterium]